MNLDAFQGPGIPDLVDIFLVGALIYAVLLGLRRSRSALILLGMLSISALYGLALSIGLQLTSLIFQSLFAVLLIALVVIFQEEIRSFFESFAVWIVSRRSRRDGRSPLTSAEVEILVTVLGDLARDRIGALIVLKGADELSRHLRGGVELGAKLSEPLLKSLFDPHSIGHDGAVVIVGDRATHFSCHLPLSSDVEKLDGRGTRHAAALGIAERTDCLCLVISEERGTISVAKDGRLAIVEDLAHLSPTIESFLQSTRPAAATKRWLEFLKKDWRYKIAALALAVFLWFFFVHESVVEYRSYVVPVEPRGLQDGFAVKSIDPPRVRVVVSAPRRTFYFVNPDKFRMSLNLFDSRGGTQDVSVTASDLDVHNGLTFVNLVPRSVRVTIEPSPEGEP